MTRLSKRRILIITLHPLSAYLLAVIFLIWLTLGSKVMGKAPAEGVHEVKKLFWVRLLIQIRFESIFYVFWNIDKVFYIFGTYIKFYTYFSNIYYIDSRFFYILYILDLIWGSIFSHANPSTRASNLFFCSALSLNFKHLHESSKFSRYFYWHNLSTIHCIKFYFSKTNF